MEDIKIPSLGDRMKKYEDTFRHYLPPRMPIIIRLDGKAFHGVTSKCEKPFDEKFIGIMNNTAMYLMENIQGAELAYIQSDEISILVHYYKKFNSASWFDNNIQKIVSVSAGMASAKFTHAWCNAYLFDSKFKGSRDSIECFDSRCFILPENEVVNYFIWRQKDWERNSIQMLARSLYSHKELQNKKTEELQDMCFHKDKNWNDLPTHLKRGRCIEKDVYAIDMDIPIFSENRNYIERHLKVEDSGVEKIASDNV